MFHSIVKINSNCKYSIQFIPAETIDEIGIKPATHKAMRLAAEKLASIINIEHILIDGNDNFPFEIARMGARGSCAPPARRTLLTDYNYIIKGDALCDCIAAASILAKVSRDHYMIEMAEKYPQYGFQKHKGYGTAAHIDTIRKFGLCPLHRRSFMTAKVLGC